MLMSDVMHCKAVNSGVFSNDCNTAIDPSTSTVFLCGFGVKSHIGITLICETWLSLPLAGVLICLSLFGCVFGSPELKFVDECCLWLTMTAAARSANVERCMFLLASSEANDSEENVIARRLLFYEAKEASLLLFWL